MPGLHNNAPKLHIKNTAYGKLIISLSEKAINVIGKAGKTLTAMTTNITVFYDMIRLGRSCRLLLPRIK
jgi:hypothetical protein